MVWSESESIALYKLDFIVFCIAPFTEARGIETEANGKDRTFLMLTAKVVETGATWDTFQAQT